MTEVDDRVKRSNVNNSTKYSGNLTGGSLLIRESRIVARLLLESPEGTDIPAKVVDGNLFQNNSQATTRKYCQLILTRLQNLTREQIRLIIEGTEETVRKTLFVAVLKTYSIIIDFVREVFLDKIRCYEPKLDTMDWLRFIEGRESIDPKIRNWTESSRKKMGQVVIRMLKEAGYLDSTRKMTIQFPHIPLDLANTLAGSGDAHILACLRLGKGT